MKRIFFSLLLLGAIGALRGKSDSEKPIDSDHLTYDDVKQVNVATGNVV